MPKAGTIGIGIDIGGTFTDVQVLDEGTGALNNLKTPTTPDDPLIGLMAVIDEAAQRFGFDIADIVPSTLLPSGRLVFEPAQQTHERPKQQQVHHCRCNKGWKSNACGLLTSSRPAPLSE